MPEGARAVQRWLDTGADTSILVTSRQPLGLSLEVRLELSPLDEEAGAALFEAKSAAFAVPMLETERATLREIVRRLDGLPLAIELAAARTPLLSPREILDRLDDRLGLLAYGPRDLPARQSTLRGAIDWSWQLLDEAEREVFRKSAAFRGPITLAAFESVIGPPATLEVLQALREKSFFRRSGQPALRHFESVREYGEEKLIESGQAEDVFRDHAQYFVDRAEAFAERLTGPEGRAAQDALEADLDDLIAVHQRFRRSDPGLAARALLHALSLVVLRGPYPHQLEMVDRAIECARRSGDETLIGRAYLARGEALTLRRRHAEASRALETALRFTVDPRDRAGALRWLGIIAREEGESEAEQHFSEALALARSVGDRALEARCLSHLGTLRRLQRREEEALALYGAALELMRKLQNVSGRLVVLGNIGHLHLSAGRLEEAAASYREALETHPDRSDRRAEATLRHHLALVEARLDGVSAAGRLARQALAVFEELEDTPMRAITHAELAAISAMDSDLDGARAWMNRARASLLEGEACRWAPVVEALAAFVDLAAGDVTAARAALETARHRASAIDICAHQLANVVPWLERALEERTCARITIAPDGSWFAIDDGTRVDLSRRPVLARVVCCLLEARLREPQRFVSADDLLAHAWGGEKMRRQSGQARVYTAIKTLRRIGLEAVLITREDGYALDPNVALIRAEIA